MRVFENNPASIGNTPLVRLNKICAAGNTFLAKIEGRNPAYSVKCRIGAALLWDALEKGKLRKGMTVIEPTSGNTGIGLAYAGAAMGIKVALIMPDNMSAERRMLMSAFGAECMLTDGALGMKGAVDKAVELAAKEPDRYFLPQQFENPANPAIHRATTGVEIWNDTDGQVDVIVSGIGTGGTITGIAQCLKLDKKKNIIAVGVEPDGSPVITQFMAGKPMIPGSHRIQGIGAGFIPKTLDVKLLDKVVTVPDDAAYDWTKRLATEEGILAGISSGAAVWAADTAVRELGLQGKTIVIILPDSGERYLSANIF
ncbi:cysteine synthase A [Geovibrio thiophilus]|uniref:Cysteine synthase n=1 Tax=Geovibrio thiophilus TaxID=139438 RepID=A0A410JUM2_9BACT|nr:cysteine synthase A [Geovibrio thiophilus]QAR31883.1 cysteine synthase A [Geovibrio thiophilus]